MFCNIPAGRPGTLGREPIFIPGPRFILVVGPNVIDVEAELEDDDVVVEVAPVVVAVDGAPGAVVVPDVATPCC